LLQRFPENQALKGRRMIEMEFGASAF